MTKTITIHKFSADLEAQAKEVSQEVRKHAKGSAGHQGDVYCHPIKSRPACWNVETTAENVQVAVGQGEGSNHRAIGPGARVFWPTSAQEASDKCPVRLFVNNAAARLQCLGPIVEAPNGFTLTHPKHAHHEFPPGTYLISYQLDMRTMRRVQD